MDDFSSKIPLTRVKVTFQATFVSPLINVKGALSLTKIKYGLCHNQGHAKCLEKTAFVICDLGQRYGSKPIFRAASLPTRFHVHAKINAFPFRLLRLNAEELQSIKISQLRSLTKALSVQNAATELKYWNTERFGNYV